MRPDVASAQAVAFGVASIHRILRQAQATFAAIPRAESPRGLVEPHAQREALAEVVQLQKRLDAESQALVTALLERGVSWEIIARTAGLENAGKARRRWGKTVTGAPEAGRSTGKTRPSFKPADLPGVSIPDAAILLGVSTSTVYTRIERGELDAVEVPKTHTAGVWRRVVDERVLGPKDPAS